MKKMDRIGNIIQNPFEFDISELENFLSKINSTINEIRKSDIKNYSLLSSIFNCFYENKKTSLPKQTIYDYIHQDVIKYKGKMIISFVSNGTNKKEIIDENNYLRKTYSIISKNKCLIQQSNNYISIDLMFIQSHKNLIYRNVFGKDEELFISDNPKKKKKLKKLENPTDNLEEEFKSSQDIKNIDDDFEIEIIGNEQDETETSIINNKDISINNTQSNNTNSKTINLGIQPKTIENTYLKKKRKSIRKIREHKNNIEEENEEQNNITNYISNNMNNKKIYNIVKDSKRYNKGNKKKILEETEIKSFIEEGKLFLSLFTDKELLNELDTNNDKNNLEENDSFIKSILLNYNNQDTLKNYLNTLNDDYNEFQNNLKTLINYKSSLNDSNNNTFLIKFSILNKIILGKKKCILLIDKMITKSSQLMLEYNFIKKILNSIDTNKVNKVDIFQKFKDVMSTTHSKQEKGNFIQNLKMKLLKELNETLMFKNNEK